MATVVAWGAESQRPAVLAEVSWMNQCHHVLIPGLGSCAGQRSEEAIG